MSLKFSLPPLKIILGGLFLLLLIFVAINNFLNIFSLEKLIPKGLGPVKAPEKITLNCPVPKIFCDQAKPIVYQGKNLGLGFTLPTGTKITAVFPGILEEVKEDMEIKVKPHPVLLLKGKNLPDKEFLGYSASYDFFGVPTSSSTSAILTQGQSFASSTAESFPTTPPFNGINFILSIFKEGTPIDFEFK